MCEPAFLLASCVLLLPSVLQCNSITVPMHQWPPRIKICAYYCYYYYWGTEELGTKASSEISNQNGPAIVHRVVEKTNTICGCMETKARVCWIHLCVLPLYVCLLPNRNVISLGSLKSCWCMTSRLTPTDWQLCVSCSCVTLKNSDRKDFESSLDIANCHLVYSKDTIIVVIIAQFYCN